MTNELSPEEAAGLEDAALRLAQVPEALKVVREARRQIAGRGRSSGRGPGRGRGRAIPIERSP